MWILVLVSNICCSLDVYDMYFCLLRGDQTFLVFGCDFCNLQNIDGCFCSTLLVMFFLFLFFAGVI